VEFQFVDPKIQNIPTKSSKFQWQSPTRIKHCYQFYQMAIFPVTSLIAPATSAAISNMSDTASSRNRIHEHGYTLFTGANGWNL